MKLKQHYPHLCMHAIRSHRCSAVHHVIASIVTALRTGVEDDPLIQLSFAVGTCQESASLQERGVKLKHRLDGVRWYHHVRMRSTDTIAFFHELQGNIDTGVCEVTLRENKTGENAWIPRWYISYDTNANMRNDSGVAELVIMKTMREIESCSPDRRNALIEGIVTSLDVANREWDYAYFEVGDETEHSLGDAYSPFLASMIRWNDAIRYRLWSHARIDDRETTSERRRQRPCKGVYWGNLFGPEILARLGGKDAFIAEFKAAKEEAGSDGAWLREMRSGGVFFTLSGELLDCWHVTASPLISFSPALRMAVWLWDRLRNADLLL